MNLHLEHTIVRAFFHYISVTLVAIVIVTHRKVSYRKQIIKVKSRFLTSQ